MHTRIRAVLIAALTALGLLTATAFAAAAAGTDCDRGEFCLWPRDGHQGPPLRFSLADTNPGECVPLPEGVDARSFVNQLSRPVTVYQSRECATEGDFTTYPGEGTFVPEAPFVVRGLQIWSS